VTYKKVFTTSRYQAKSQNSFSADPRLKRVLVGSRGNLSAIYAYLGKVIEQGKAGNLLDFEVHCDVSFPHVIGVFGSRGSGKSFDLGVFLEGIFLSEAPQGPRDAGIVFDIQDQFWTLAYEPSPDIQADASHLADLARWGLRPSALPSVSVLIPSASDTPVPGAIRFSLAPTQLSPADWLAILELERFSAMGQALLALLNENGMRTPGELAELIDTSQAMANFQQGTADGVRWRLESLQQSQMIDNQGISVDDLLRPGTLSVVLMRNLSDAVRGLVVGVVARLVSDRMGRAQQVRKIAMRTGASTGDEGELASRLWMVLDEAHVLIPSDGSTAATEPLIDYVKRGRDAGLSLIFATKQTSAVNSKLMSQVDLTITHTLGFDADLSAAVARMPTRTAVDYDVDNEKVGALTELIRSLSPGEAVFADGSSGRVFVGKVRPRITAHGGASPT
jgi:hypothetical protein